MRIEVLGYRTLKYLFVLTINIIIPNLVNGFLPNNLHQCGASGQADYTHESMITSAIKQATEEFLFSKNNHTSLSQYEAVRSIIDGSDYLDRIGYKEAANHFNGEEILQANNKLKFFRRMIQLYATTESVHKYSSIRYLMGQYMHILQDFYSNTDWIPLDDSNSIYKNLGVENRTFLKVDIRKALPACRVYSDTPVAPVHANDWISSGYRSEQDSLKPPGTSVSDGWNGKCSHGGIYDSSALQPPEGGINSESFNHTLSPNSGKHKRSADSAKMSSELFLSFKDEGILNSIPQSELPELLGNSAARHFSLMVTKELLTLSQSLSWAQKISNINLSEFPWAAMHLYTDHGDEVGTATDLLQASVLGTKEPVGASQSNLLKASLCIPEYATLSLVVGGEHPLEEGRDEETLKKILISRHIRLVIFYIQGSKLPDKSLIPLRRVCLATHGHLFSVNQPAHILDLLFNMEPLNYHTHFRENIEGKVMAPVLPQQTLLLMVNCQDPNSMDVDITSSSGNVGLNVQKRLDTGATALYTIASSSSTQGTNIVLSAPNLYTGGKYVMPPCLVSAWYNGEPPVRSMAISDGHWGQRFYNNMRVREGGSRLLVTVGKGFASSVTVKQVKSSDTLVDVTDCNLHLTGRSLPAQYLSGSLNSDIQPDSVEVLIETNGDTVTVEEYIHTEQVEIIAPNIVYDSEPVAVSLTNKMDSVSYQVTALSIPEIQIEISQKTFLLADGETFEFQANFSWTAYGIIKDISPVTLLLTGKDSLGTKFHSAHTFQLLVNKTTPAPSTTTSTTRLSTTGENSETVTSFPPSDLRNWTQPTDPVLSNSTTDDLGTVSPVLKSGVNYMTEFCAKAFFLSLFGTIVVILVPIMTIAGIMYCIHNQKRKRMMRQKEKDLEFLDEEHRLFIDKEHKPITDLENNIHVPMTPVTSL